MVDCKRLIQFFRSRLRRILVGVRLRVEPGMRRSRPAPPALEFGLLGQPFERIEFRVAEHIQRRETLVRLQRSALHVVRVVGGLREHVCLRLNRRFAQTASLFDRWPPRSFLSVGVLFVGFAFHVLFGHNHWTCGAHATRLLLKRQVDGWSFSELEGFELQLKLLVGLIVVLRRLIDDVVHELVLVDAVISRNRFAAVNDRRVQIDGILKHY